MRAPKSKSIPVPADYNTEQRIRHRMVVIRQDLVRVARLIGLPEGFAPSLLDYETYGRYTAARACKTACVPRHHWKPAMAAFRLKLKRGVGRLSDQDMIEDVRRVARELGQPDVMPAQRDYARLGRIAWTTVWDRFGGDGQGWAGVARRCNLRMTGTRAPRYRDRAAFVADYQRVARELGYKPGSAGPSSGEFRKYVEYNPYTAAHRWGGDWTAFVREAGFTGRQMHSGRPRAA